MRNFCKNTIGPGNVRELQNVIARAMIVSKGARLRLDLAMAFGSLQSVVSDHEKETQNSSGAKVIRSHDLKRLERDSIITALERAHWRVSGVGGAAQLLGVNPNTLASRIRSLGIKRKRAD
jgi:transcriptional regulator with GAF, ATPase, and Fis domain